MILLVKKWPFQEVSSSDISATNCSTFCLPNLNSHIYSFSMHLPSSVPADAPQEEQPERRASIISLNLEGKKNDLDLELGVRFDESYTRRISLQRSVVTSSRGALRILLAGMKKMLESPYFQALTFVATIYALFAFDLNLAVGNKGSDLAIDYTTFAVFFIFIIELVFSLACVPGYTKFFFWLDFVATVSLWFEIGFLMRGFGGNLTGANELALAKAGRAAKVSEIVVSGINLE